MKYNIFYFYFCGAWSCCQSYILVVRVGFFFCSFPSVLTLSSFFFSFFSVRVDVDGVPCKNLKLTSSPKLTGGSVVEMVASCDAPPASGEVVPHFSSLSILIDDVHGSTNVKSLRYMSPLVTTIYPREIPATGYEDITIRGEHFGNADQGQIIKASINGSLCEKTEWISSTEIKCRVPPGHTEAPASVIVSVNGHTNPRNINNQLLRYKGPKVLSVMPTRGPAYGGTRITITGRGLASMETPEVSIPFVTIANASCLDVEVISGKKTWHLFSFYC